MKKTSSADIVGEALSDLAWQRVIVPGSTEQNTTLQAQPLIGFECNEFGVITRFFRGNAARVEV